MTLQVDADTVAPLIRALHAPVRYHRQSGDGTGEVVREVRCLSGCWTAGSSDPMAWPCPTALIVATREEIAAERAWVHE